MSSGARRSRFSLIRAVTVLFLVSESIPETSSRASASLKSESVFWFFEIR
jgi:hypothetical protein